MYEYAILESATGCVVDYGVCSEEEKYDLKLEWPAKDGYEIMFNQISV